MNDIAHCVSSAELPTPQEAYDRYLQLWDTAGRTKSDAIRYAESFGFDITHRARFLASRLQGAEILRDRVSQLREQQGHQGQVEPLEYSEAALCSVEAIEAFCGAIREHIARGAPIHVGNKARSIAGHCHDLMELSAVAVELAGDNTE